MENSEKSKTEHLRAIAAENAYRAHLDERRVNACIELRVPETGDDVLDALIAKAQRRDAAVAAMQGILAADTGNDIGDLNCANIAKRCADALLSALEGEE